MMVFVGLADIMLDPLSQPCLGGSVALDFV